MTKLSVNINKLATLRNARGGNNPDLLKATKDIQRYGAEGITVHPRPDERHIRYNDVRDLKSLINVEFNIEGNPREQKFIDLVLQTLPHQVTLVPDTLNQLTSDHGWNTKLHKEYLKDVIQLFKSQGIRVSLFIDPDIDLIHHAVDTGTDRIELYTESFAKNYTANPTEAVFPYTQAAIAAHEVGLGINAGHDLDLHNLAYFAKHVPYLAEVSIGHALICDAIYYGLENTIQLYKRCLTNNNN